MSSLRSPRAVTSADQGAWSGRAAPAETLSVVQLIRNGTLDAELAGLLWLLVEARVPLLVAAGPRLAGKTTLLSALLDFLPPGVVTHELAGYAEDFQWLPEAGRLGWQPEPGGAVPGPPTGGISPTNGYLVAAELSPHLPFYTWGQQARIAVRSLSLGYGLGATIHADSLEEVFDELGGPDVGLNDDEVSHVGVVLILRAMRRNRADIIRRVAAAHYVRPISRDQGGHVQRLSPAVLATWDAASDAFEHFAWGVTAELAMRVGRSPGDFAAEQERRRDVLGALAAAGVESPADVRTAIDGYRLSSSKHHH